MVVSWEFLLGFYIFFLTDSGQLFILLVITRNLYDVLQKKNILNVDKEEKKILVHFLVKVKRKLYLMGYFLNLY